METTSTTGQYKVRGGYFGNQDSKFERTIEDHRSLCFMDAIPVKTHGQGHGHTRRRVATISVPGRMHVPEIPPPSRQISMPYHVHSQLDRTATTRHKRANVMTDNPKNIQMAVKVRSPCISMLTSL